MLDDRFTIRTLSEAGINEDIVEDAQTLEGNARLKAKYVYDRLQCNVFADDTGLEVTSLNGAPGVHSARYAGEERSSEANIAKLLTALHGQENRSARFRTSICLIYQGQVHFFEGIAEGVITTSRRGSGGFGYDSIFEPILEPSVRERYGHQHPTFAELSASDKNRTSHRGKAVNALISFLSSLNAE
jgi:XTP/dITP diphosphohydrolase